MIGLIGQNYQTKQPYYLTYRWACSIRFPHLAIQLGSGKIGSGGAGIHGSHVNTMAIYIKETALIRVVEVQTP